MLSLSANLCDPTLLLFSLSLGSTPLLCPCYTLSTGPLLCLVDMIKNDTLPEPVTGGSSHLPALKNPRSFHLPSQLCSAIQDKFTLWYKCRLHRGQQSILALFLWKPWPFVVIVVLEVFSWQLPWGGNSFTLILLLTSESVEWIQHKLIIFKTGFMLNIIVTNIEDRQLINAKFLWKTKQQWWQKQSSYMELCSWIASDFPHGLIDCSLGSLSQK